MSKAEMAVHNIKPDSLRFEQQNLRCEGEFTVVDLICDSYAGDEFRLKMFMDETGWRTPVEVDIAGLKIVGVEEDQLPQPVVEVLREYLDYLEHAHIDAKLHGRNDEARSYGERAEEVALMVVTERADTEKGGSDDGTQDQEHEQG